MFTQMPELHLGGERGPLCAGAAEAGPKGLHCTDEYAPFFSHRFASVLGTYPQSDKSLIIEALTIEAHHGSGPSGVQQAGAAARAGSDR